mgnify:CR=1 FL=1
MCSPDPPKVETPEPPPPPAPPPPAPEKTVGEKAQSGKGPKKAKGSKKDSRRRGRSDLRIDLGTNSRGDGLNIPRSK